MGSTTLAAQLLGDEIVYTVQPTCDSPTSDKPTLLEQYYIQLDITSLKVTEGDFDIEVDGQSVLQFHVDASDIPYRRLVGPYTHSQVGGTFRQYAITSLQTGTADTLYLPEVYCGRLTHNGLNAAGYYCRDGGGVVAQVKPEVLDTPELPEKTYIYVLVHRESAVLIDRNFSGYFSGVTDLEKYEVHAFSVSFEEQAQALNAMVIGEVLDQADFSFCYAHCGIFDVVVDCSSFDLSLQKNVQGDLEVFSLGDTVIFDITVYNDGLVTAYDVVVEDVIPSALEFIPSLSPLWTMDLTSKPIDSIVSGTSAVLPIAMRVSTTVSEVEVVNLAEIIFAARQSGDLHPAFDADSTPNNQDSSEDDEDTETITVLQNLCAITFDVDADHEVVCEGDPMTLVAHISMANYPVQYLWIFNGQEVSRDSLYIIDTHGPEHYGQYTVVITDHAGCEEQMDMMLEPVINDDRFGCYNDVYVGVNADCSIDLYPSMLTSTTVSALDDFGLILIDEDGHQPDLTDLSMYGPGTVIEARVSNPCTGEIMCWSRVHLEYKGTPQANVYDEVEREIVCPLVDSRDPSDVIQTYNELYPDQEILDAPGYLEATRGASCLQTWDVRIVDQMISGTDPCEGDLVRRIYFVDNQEALTAIDTAYLRILRMDIDSIVLPSDVSGWSCSNDTDPVSLSSVPGYMIGGRVMDLVDVYAHRSATFCSTGITYTDQYVEQPCAFGASKVIRTWSVLDWCTDQRREEIQFIFIKDGEDPEARTLQSNISLEAAPFACAVTVNINDYLETSDNCDASPTVEIAGFDDPTSMHLPIGSHHLNISVADACGNATQLQMHVNVTELTPPVPILKQDLAIGVSDIDQLGDLEILASLVDAGSHDYECGPVGIHIARQSELSLIDIAQDQWSVTESLQNCMQDLTSLDADNSGTISTNEIYRSVVQICCQDIGHTLALRARVMDIAGNVAFADLTIEIQAKLDGTTCDDGDPCTVDDQQYGDCPCQGQPDMSDFDEDNIVDCEDPTIVICLNGVSQSVTKEELQSYIDQGATGGRCPDAAAMASIAGEVYTLKKEMIEDVTITLNNSKKLTTKEDGRYLFGENAMYADYELFPQRLGDDLNGVSAIDLVFIQEHILGQRLITDPYLMIAADINNDGRISALDLVALRSLLLGQSDRFSSNSSWRFVIENFEFDDRQDPYDFQEINVIYDLDHDMMKENWIGIKIGDINLSALPNSQKASSRSVERMTIELPDLAVSTGDRVRIPISLADEEALRSLQMSLSMEGIQINGLSSADMTISPSEYQIRDDGTQDVLTIVWSSPELIRPEVMFYIDAEVLKDGKLGSMIQLDDFGPRPFMGDADYEDIPIHLNFVEQGLSLDATDVHLYQNQPNPFNGQTIIQFEIPERGEVRITFFNNAGRILHDIIQTYHPGVNAIRLTHDDISLWEGVVYYQMSYRGETLSRKMIVTK